MKDEGGNGDGEEGKVPLRTNHLLPAELAFFPGKLAPPVTNGAPLAAAVSQPPRLASCC